MRPVHDRKCNNGRRKNPRLPILNGLLPVHQYRLPVILDFCRLKLRVDFVPDAALWRRVHNVMIIIAEIGARVKREGEIDFSSSLKKTIRSQSLGGKARGDLVIMVEL